MAASGTKISSAISVSSGMQVTSVDIITKYLYFATFSNGLCSCNRFALHSGDEIFTYTGS
jgi:hypothetical protein